MRNLNPFARIGFVAAKRLVAMILVFAISSNVVFAEIFTVNNNGNGADEDTADNICEVTNNVGDCTFRAAVQQANVSAGTDTINFPAGTTTITPGSAITISSNVIVNSSANNRLVMDGASTAAYNALILDGNSDGSQIRGLTINNYDGIPAEGLPPITAIEIQSDANNITIGGHVNYGNIIGLNNDGTTADANTRNGIGISSAGTNVTINNNLISNNTTGIKITGGTGHTITKNTIGLDSANADKGNTGDGIFVSGPVSLTGEGLVIGGSQAASLDNKIGGNGGHGIRIGDGAGAITGTATIMGNFIGTDAGNDGDGIFVDTNASGLDITIGTDGNGSNDTTEGNEIGLNAGQGMEIREANNLIIAGNKIGHTAAGTAKGNGNAGVWVGTATQGPSTLRLGSDNGDDNEMNSIGSNGVGGVLINNAVTINASGNYIGFGPGGTDDRGNFGGDAFKINSTEATTVNIGTGGSIGSNGFQNYFGNNTGGTNGTLAITNTASGATVNIRNNRIGVSTVGDGNTAKANSQGGMYLSAPANYYIGTNLDGIQDDTEYNLVVNANGGNGIYITGSALTASVMGTIVGLVSTGFGGAYSVAAGNGFSAAAGDKNGMKFNSASLTSAIVGGTSTYQRNVIGSNYENGISLVQLAPSGTANIYNNYIGVGSNGTTDVGNVSNGINIAFTTAGPTVNIGGIASTQGNVISGNAGNGISVTGGFIHGVNVYQNIIGLVAAATSALANDLAGITLQGNLVTTIIGNGVSTGRNVISGNTGYGIGITGGNVTVKGNYLGTETTGATAVANTAGSINATGTGGSISSLTIGSGTEKNIIGNTTQSGIVLSGVTATNETTSVLNSDNTWLDLIGPFTSSGPSYYWWYRSASEFGPKACRDGVDNDSDGKTDYGTDLGCTGYEDNDESGEVATSSGGGAVVLVGGGFGGSATSGPSATPVNIPTPTVTPTPTVIQTVPVPAIQTPQPQDEIIEEEVQPEEVPVEEVAEPVLTDTQKYYIQQKLYESVNVVLPNNNVNVDLIVDFAKAAQMDEDTLKLEALNQLPKTPEQQVIQVGLDKLQDGEKLTSVEQGQVEATMQKVVQQDLTEQFQKMSVSAIPVTLSNGKMVTFDKMPEIQVTLDAQKGAAIQNLADLKGKKVLVVTPSTTINNNVSALLSIQNGAKVGDPQADDKMFFGGPENLANTADKIEDLKPSKPMMPNLKSGSVVGTKPLIWLAGPQAGGEVSLFIVDKNGSENPKQWKDYKLGKQFLDSTFKGVVDPDFTDKMGDADSKPFMVVVQDKNGKGTAVDIIVKKNLGINLDTLTLQNGNQTMPIDLTSARNVSLAAAAVVKGDKPTEEADNQITVRGYAEPGSLINVTWKSVLKTSTVIADASQGYFEVQVPKGLDKGNHTAYTYSSNPQKKTASNFSKILFNKIF